MLELRTDIEIDAPVERVWEVLTDFDRFPDWNPFIRRIRGNAQVGSRLDVFLGASGTRGMRFRPTVTKVVPNREVRWPGGWGLQRRLDTRDGRRRPCGHAPPGVRRARAVSGRVHRFAGDARPRGCDGRDEARDRPRREPHT